MKPFNFTFKTYSPRASRRRSVLVPVFVAIARWRVAMAVRALNVIAHIRIAGSRLIE